MTALADRLRPGPGEHCEVERANNQPCFGVFPDRADLWCIRCVQWRVWRHEAERERIQRDFTDDLADREGNLYEQIKDLVEQFHVEREEHAANADDLARCRQILSADIVGTADVPLPAPAIPVPVESVAFCLYEAIQELRSYRRTTANLLEALRELFLRTVSYVNLSRTRGCDIRSEAADDVRNALATARIAMGKAGGDA